MGLDQNSSQKVMSKKQRVESNDIGTHLAQRITHHALRITRCFLYYNFKSYFQS